MGGLHTTTARYRNYDLLNELKHEVIRLGIRNPTIIDIGPGGLVNFLFPYFPHEKKERNLPEKVYRGVIKLAESVIRKTDLFDLESSEPREIVEIFADLQPKIIYVIDTEPRVIESVKKLAQNARLGVNLDYKVIDIESQRVPYQGDVVIAYNVVLNKTNPTALETIASAVSTGGLLSITPDKQIERFKRIQSGIYQRTS